jgi:acyl dehydratase
MAPVYPGEELEASVRVKDKYLKNDKRFVVLEITVRKLENARIALVAERSLVWPN